ncbi:bifunctional phosphopantothenoylcysteine decarboxylase/phosphopantothenate--cysteine ligase CoaBC [Methanonatronarchaeum sp. AMET-Sl]|uniref:bifunctional phosphopantothenoylcysteine decarboxylase/phosphopantothenate--cysteine ligase CoaBC n=1 Tax=Methanonatronarchaeum sp. AMET-Sl TaxID=3037654 RepID=UPI00244E4B20|nr:bifunctional phosphopantothenoylcysteine decarboxylase/phosphopantothenate--cysteine ligase CoaBC [Methanonatronarchaeum sp. AMET-Sl]WGI16926.1 bifunctional phosphopantothenoylcysteine decarboxylase/phosphopantothenate--cysteine ligase CoaBC [Methanonatronarchaeum sp. AMET-Sl]
MSFDKHPTHDIQAVKSDSLMGKKIVLGVTGSIAAIMSVKLSRELIRHGASVQAVMTGYAENIVHENTLEYATGKPVVTELTGKVEHVRDLSGDNTADLFLIAPATANTIGKIASGIDDTTVTTYATTALSRDIPIVVVPAMDLSMYKQPFVEKNIDKLMDIDVCFIGPEIEENKAKMASINEIVVETRRMLGENDLRGKKVLVTGGATAESIDDVRILTNRSSGRMGVEIARSAYLRGADTKLVLGRSVVDAPVGVETKKVESALEMEEEVMKEFEEGVDVFISAAAISDFIPEKVDGKIRSGEPRKINLKPSEKIIKKAIKQYPDTKVVGFKLEPTLKESLESAEKKLNEIGLDLIVANPVSTMGSEETNAYLVSKNGSNHIKGDKKKVANEILNKIQKNN